MTEKKRARRCTTTEKDVFAFHASNGDHGNELDAVRAWLKRNKKKGEAPAKTLRNFILADQREWEENN